MNIEETLKKYQKIDSNNLIEYIKNIVDEKSNLGEWDKGIKGESENLVTMLLYEYATAIEKLTERKILAKQVVDKISNQMGKLRLGDFKNGIDDSVTYNSNSVTSDAYKRDCRISTHFGAHALQYFDKNGESKDAIVLFDSKQKALIDGKEYELSGIDLQDLSDIKGTIFHEWTHVMERCMIKASELSREDIIYTDGNSTYINSMLSPDLSIKELESYIANIDNMINSNEKVQFGGISTIEVNKVKSPNKRIMHNQISEGATEYVARKVMGVVGAKVKHQDRYAEQVKIVGKIFECMGLADSLTMYFTEPHKMIRSLEGKRVERKDMLHCISEYINSSHIIRIFTRLKIDNDGNIRTSMISKLIERMKNFHNKNNYAMLPDVEEKQTTQEEGNDFLEGLKVPTENLKIPIKMEKLNKKDKNKEGPSLDD